MKYNQKVPTVIVAGKSKLKLGFSSDSISPFIHNHSSQSTVGNLPNFNQTPTMSRIMKRVHSSLSSPFYRQSPTKKQFHLNDDDDDVTIRADKSESDRRSMEFENGNRLQFVCYLDRPDLPPNLRVLCEIIAKTPNSALEMALEGAQIRVSHQDVEQILKLSYGFPSAALKFFRWAERQFDGNHSPYSWNLVVDLLGQNLLFDAMWDAISSMRSKGFVTLATFASVFSSYVRANGVQEAFRLFEMIEIYGFPRNVVALNTLLSAVCRNSKTKEGFEFFGAVKSEIKPDADSFAILLEGWESEGNLMSAKMTFDEMVGEIGWDPGNSCAYDSFMCSLIKGPNGLHEALKFFGTLKEKRCYPGVRFFRFALEECARKMDARGAALIWEAMTMRSNVAKPDTNLYNLMISLHCRLNNPDIGSRFLGEMVREGVTPDSQTYGVLIRSYIKCGRPKDALVVFDEMTKSEVSPSYATCIDAVRACLEAGDPCSADKFWKYSIAKHGGALGETGDLMIMGLMDRSVKLNAATLTSLKDGGGKMVSLPGYDEVLKSWSNLNRPFVSVDSCTL